MLTAEEIRILAKSERLMDEGKVAFVRLGSHRVSVQPEVMTAMGLVHGQTINDVLFGEILQQHLRLAQEELRREVDSAVRSMESEMDGDGA